MSASTVHWSPGEASSTLGALRLLGHRPFLYMSRCLRHRRITAATHSRWHCLQVHLTPVRHLLVELDWHPACTPSFRRPLVPVSFPSRGLNSILGGIHNRLDVTEAREAGRTCSQECWDVTGHREEMMKAATIGRSSELGPNWEPPGMVPGTRGPCKSRVVSRRIQTLSNAKRECELFPWEAKLMSPISAA